MARGRPDYIHFEFGSETVATEDTILRLSDTQVSGGGAVAFALALVAPGDALELNHIYACNTTSATPRITAYVPHIAPNFYITTELNVPAYTPLTWTGEIWLREGDFIIFYFAGTIAGDVLVISAFGKTVIRR